VAVNRVRLHSRFLSDASKQLSPAGGVFNRVPALLRHSVRAFRAPRPKPRLPEEAGTPLRKAARVVRGGARPPPLAPGTPKAKDSPAGPGSPPLGQLSPRPPSSDCPPTAISLPINKQPAGLLRTACAPSHNSQRLAFLDVAVPVFLGRDLGDVVGVPSLSFGVWFPSRDSRLSWCGQWRGGVHVQMTTPHMFQCTSRSPCSSDQQHTRVHTCSQE
jgi:hypothetical protein